MSDMEGPALLGEHHRLLVKQMMQAYVLYNLSKQVPVAFLAELRFHQVRDLLSHACLFGVHVEHC